MYKSEAKEDNSTDFDLKTYLLPLILVWVDGKAFPGQQRDIICSSRPAFVLRPLYVEHIFKAKWKVFRMHPDWKAKTRETIDLDAEAF